MKKNIKSATYVTSYITCVGIASIILFTSLGFAPGRSKPVIKNGYYYNDTYDNRNHLLDGPAIFYEMAKNSASYGSCDAAKWYVKTVPAPHTQKPCITWIGHASFLIQIGGYNILTDPVFENLPLFKRKSPAGLTPEIIPAIDFVVISHNHRDHTNLPSLQKIKDDHNPLFLIPEGTKKLFTKNGITNVIEKTWWQKEITTKNNRQITITFLPAYHWSGVGLFDTRMSLWGSWMIECNGHTLYFAGDSAYAPHFKEIATQFPSIDVALLPIAPGTPRNQTKHSHMDTQEAVQAFLDLNAKTFIPMHWGTFRLGPDPFDYPITILNNCWEQQSQQLQNKELAILKFGGQWAAS